MMSSEQRRQVINFRNIPDELQQLPNWAFYTYNKAPIKVGAVARNWPMDGWNHGLNSPSSEAGARSNDPNTWARFEDLVSVYNKRIATGDTLASTKIAGPTIALQAHLGYTVIDLDDPARSIRDKVSAQTGQPFTDAEREFLINSARDSQSIVLRMFQGHYIERSASGKGYHIFVKGKLPFDRYRFGFHGSVFSSGQFINMTGDTEDLGTWTSDTELQYRNVVTLDGQPKPEWVKRDVPLVGPVIGGHLQDGQGVLNNFNEYFANPEVGVLSTTSNEEDNKYFEEGEIFEIDYVRNGRRTDLPDDQVILKLSKGMQAVYNGGSISGDHSEDTFHLLGDLEKISASAAQIERIMKKSPRMLNAGLGNDGQPRWEKHFKNFNRNLARVRRDNDKKFSQWESKGTAISDERREEMRKAFEKLTSVDDPNSIAYKLAQIERERIAREEEAKRIHRDMMAQRVLGRRQFTGTAESAIRLLSCGIDPAYLSENCMPPGRMHELCYYIHEGMYEPYMKFAIPAAFASLAGIVARKYKLHDKDGEALSLCFVMLAKSAIGKTQAVKAIESFQYDLRREINFKARFEDRDIASKQGFHEILQNTPCLTWLKDECAAQLRSIISPSHNDMNAERLRGFTSQLFDFGQAEREYHPTASVSSQKREDAAIRNLCVSMFWGSTQANVKDYFTADAIHTGIISRIVFINHATAGGTYDPTRRQLRALPQGSLRDIYKHLLLAAERMDVAYLNYPTRTSPDVADPEIQGQIAPRPYDLLVPVVMDDQAYALYQQLQVTISGFKQNIHNEISEFPDYYIALARTAMIVARMAGVMAVLDNPNQPIIRYEMVAWSLGYILNCTCGILSSFETLDIGQSTMAVANYKVMRTVLHLSSKPEAISNGYVQLWSLRNSLRRNEPFKTERNPNRAIDDVIYDLVDSGILRLGGNIKTLGVRSDTATVTDIEGKVRPNGAGCWVQMTDHDDWADFK